MTRCIPLLLCCVGLVACGDKDGAGSDTDCDELDTGDDCGTAGGGDGGGGDGGGGGGTVALADAPPQLFTVDVHDAAGLLYELELDDGATWATSYTSGVLSVAAVTGDTRVQLSLWEPVAAGETYPVIAIDEGGGLPTGANLTFIEGAAGGQAGGGSLTVTAWQKTDSPNIYLLTGTLEAGPVTNPSDPEWVRNLQDGELQAIRVTVF